MDQPSKMDKKPKSYYVDYSKRQNKYGLRRGGPPRGRNTTNNSRYKEASDVSFGQRGFLITSIDEVKSYLEMKNILIQYYHELYDEKDNVDAKKDMSTEEELESELKQLRVTRPFKQVKTHCRNSIFINVVPEFAHVDPVLIVDKFFDDLADKREIKTTNTNRVLPILDTFRSNVSCAKESVAALLDKFFNEEGPKHYFIEFQTRGNYKLDTDEKQKMIEGIAESITQLRSSWKVSRENADYIIILVALRDVCCLTILRNYFRRSKYNVIEFCKDFPPKENREQGNQESEEEKKSECPATKSKEIHS